MILTNTQYNRSTIFVTQRFPDKMREYLIKSTVRLDVGQFFKGSGVIFNVTNNVVEILTAAHNILVWKKANLPPNDWTQWAGGFAAELTVQYNPKDTKFNGAPTVACNSGLTVTVPKIDTACKDANCYYDVAVIKCVDTKMADFAKTFVSNAYDLKAEASYASQNKQWFLKKDSYFLCQLGYGLISDKRRPQKLVDCFVDRNGTPVLDDKNNPAPETQRLVDKTKPKVGVINWGNVKEVKSQPQGLGDGNLQYRIAWPENASYTCFHDQAAEKGKPIYTENCEAFELEGNAATSSAKGDSGGPVYAIEYTQTDTVDPNTKLRTKREWTIKRATLLGVTTGSDMETAAKPPTAIYKNDIATSVIPYLETRK